MDVEVEQRGGPLLLVAEQPGERGGDAGRADATTRADDGGGEVRPFRARVAWRKEYRLRLRQCIAQLVSAKGLQQIILNAAGDEVAIQADIVHLARRDHDSAGFAHFGKAVDVVQRVAAFGHVDEQDLRACADRKALHGIAHAALVHLFRGPAHFGGDHRQQIMAMIIADEGVEGIALSRHGRFPGCVHDQRPPDRDLRSPEPVGVFSR